MALHKELTVKSEDEYIPAHRDNINERALA